jgi:hypothetical protein
MILGRQVLRSALAMLATAALALCLTAAPAAAEEKVELFKTTLTEPNAFGEAAEVVAAGTVSSLSSGESFTVETYSGPTETVKISPYTRFHTTESAFFENGANVIVFGTHAGPVTVDATRVLFTVAGRPPPSGPREFAALGIVQSSAGGGTFTVETREGSIDTVDVSPSTVYRRAVPVPSEESSPPTLADVASGDGVGVTGDLSGQTVTATSVVISTPQAGGHPDLETSFTFAEPGAPEAAQNVIFNAPTGVFGNPRAITQCAPADFALDQCPPTPRLS